MLAQLDEGGRGAGLRRARPLDVDVDDLVDVRGPVAEHDDPVAEEDRLLDGVGDQHGRAPVLLAGLVQQLLHELARLGVERGERLVEQHHVGVGGVGAGERDPLAHAAGERLGQRLLEAAQPHQVDVARHDLGDLGLRPLVGAEREPEGDVLLDGEPREDRVLLEDHAPSRVGPRDPLAVDLDQSRVGRRGSRPPG